MKSSIFQIILLCVFGAFAAAGVLVFALAVGGGDEEQTIGEVVIWGTLDKPTFDIALDQASQANRSLSGVIYEQKEASTFDQELANALAERRGPDLYVITSDQAFINQAKVSLTSYENISKTQFKKAFVDAANPYLGGGGIIAIPFLTDPLVLYSNRDLLVTGGYPNPPKYWDEVQTMAQRLKLQNTSGSIEIATIALGTYRNIENAKAIISALITQKTNTGSFVQDTIVGVGTDGELRSVLAQTFGQGKAPALDAISFYTEFANPAQADYTWNGSFPSARQAFTQGQLAMYIGFASEEKLIRTMNPNLNYVVTQLPQWKGNTLSLTFGRTYGFAIPLTSNNPMGATMAAELLVSATSSTAFARQFVVASALRDALSQPGSPGVSAERKFTDGEALNSRNWIDPNPMETDAIFRDMIEATVSGAVSITDALARADQRLQRLLAQ
ncbi:extracellular solute-binding protein [Candidatus Parcubacteria bacterium]|nr:MAG: extracellular solute-binding protein [Candidatus Parcubacteria bacterium]